MLIMRRERNCRLIVKRNIKICARYYYWTEVQRLRSDDAIRQLSEEEFFLSEATIVNILRKQQHAGAAELKKLAPLKKPARLPKITADMLSLMPDHLEAK